VNFDSAGNLYGTTEHGGLGAPNCIGGCGVPRHCPFSVDLHIWRNERFTVFPKNEKENLSMAERNALRKRADSIFETYGR
jgi:hypothetical protein